MTSSPVLAKILAGVCPNDSGSGIWHRHITLLGGKRTVKAQEYPPKLVDAILRGLKQQLREDSRQLNSMCAGPTADDPEVWQDEQWSESAIGDSENGYGFASESVFYDSISEKPLDTKAVQSARQLELEWIDSMNTDKKVPIQMCYEEQGRPYDMKWIDTLKADGRTRSRLVVREIKARKKQHEKLDPTEKIAATPPPHLQGSRA